MYGMYMFSDWTLVCVDVVLRLLYILGEQTWIEYWPTKEEGQSPAYAEKYISIRSLVEMLTMFGCRQ